MFKISAFLVSLAAFNVIPMALQAGTPDLHLVVVSRIDDADDAYSPAGKIKIQLREVRVNTTGAYGKPVPHRIFLVFDPKSGAFSWNVAIDGNPGNASEQMQWFKSNRAAFLKDNSLYVFTAETGPLALYVQGPSGHAASMDNAEELAIRATGVLNDPPGNVDLVKQWQIVSLTGLSADFVHSPGNAIIGPDPKVTDVQWDGKHWVVTLQARWTEMITLDANYKVVSMQKVE